LHFNPIVISDGKNTASRGERQSLWCIVQRKALDKFTVIIRKGIDVDLVPRGYDSEKRPVIQDRGIQRTSRGFELMLDDGQFCRYIENDNS